MTGNRGRASLCFLKAALCSLSEFQAVITSPPGSSHIFHQREMRSPGRPGSFGALLERDGQTCRR
jgi:hypothetical protein